MPEGRLGKAKEGLFILSLTWSQKQRGHSRKMDMVEGESVRCFIIKDFGGGFKKDIKIGFTI